MEQEILLKLTNVVAGYPGGGDVLKGLDLELKQGSLTCIVGPMARASRRC